MTQNDGVQVPENEPRHLLADDAADLVPAPASPSDDAPGDAKNSPAGRPGNPARHAWNWLTTGVWAALAWLGLALGA